MAIPLVIDNPNVFGIDTSFWDTTLYNYKLYRREYMANFKIAKADPIAVRKFVYMKATGTMPSGVLYTDIAYRASSADATDAGWDTGVYHFYYPGKDPIAQAEYFIQKTCDYTSKWTYNYNLPPWVDYEVYAGSAAQKDLLRFLQYYENRVGVRPMIYTGLGYWNNLGNPSWSTQYELALAQYHPLTVPFVIPKPWKTYRIVQYSDKGTVPGLLGGVDMDMFNGNILEYEAWKNTHSPLPEPTYPKMLTVTVNGLRIRPIPDISSNVLGHYNIGAKLIVYEEVVTSNGIWCRISPNGSDLKWVARFYNGQYLGAYK